MAGSCEENNDSELRRVRRVNQMTRQHCVRLIQMATATLNARFQLKGRSPDLSLDAGEQNFELYDGGATAAMVMDAVLEWTAGFTYRCAKVVGTSLHYGIFIVGSLVVLALVMFVVMGPTTWRNSKVTRWFEIRHAAQTMGWRHRMFLRPSLQFAHYRLGCEIAYLRERFRRAGQQGDMMIDIESIHADLSEYLGGQRIQMEEQREAVPPEPEGGEEEHPPADDPPGGDDNGDDIVQMALNGRVIDRTPTESEMDARHGIEEGGDDDDDMGVGESAEQRRARYIDAEQGEVSDPDEWAQLHYGHLDQDKYDRMTVFPRANQQRLINARATLRERYNNAALQGNWEEAANYVRAIDEVEALMDIA